MEQHPVREPDAQKAGVGVIFVDMPVVIPLRKNRSHFGHDFLVAFRFHMSQIFADAVSGKPVAAEGSRVVLSDLSHFIGEGMGDDIKCSILIIAVYGAHMWLPILHRSQGQQIVSRIYPP